MCLCHQSQSFVTQWQRKLKCLFEAKNSLKLSRQLLQFIFCPLVSLLSSQYHTVVTVLTSAGGILRATHTEITIFSWFLCFADPHSCNWLTPFWITYELTQIVTPHPTFLGNSTKPFLFCSWSATPLFYNVTVPRPIPLWPCSNLPIP